MENKLEIHNSKKKALGLFILGIVFMLIVYKTSSFINIPVNYGLIIGAIIGISGLGLLFFQKKGPVLILTPEGLTYDTTNNHFVKWSEIEGYTDYNFNNVHTLRVNLKYPEKYIAHQDQNRQKKLRMLMKLHDTPIIISSPTFLEISKTKLKEELHEYLVKYGDTI